jgi:hypothetical protein
MFTPGGVEMACGEAGLVVLALEMSSFLAMSCLVFSSCFTLSTTQVRRARVTLYSAVSPCS